jgi:glutathione S-transferase
MLQLHSHPLSTFGRRITVALLEKDLTAEHITVDMPGRAHRGPQYLALNPYGRVPTLVDGDFVLYESTAILNYLEAIHPRPSLLPTDARGRALVDMHMKLCDLQFTYYVGTIIFPKRFMPKERWDEKAMAISREAIVKHLATVEQALGEREYLVGDRFTLADLCYLPFVEFLGLMEVTPPPAVARWTTRLLERSSARATKPSH